jgi:nucleoid-associated protein YgaU
MEISSMRPEERVFRIDDECYLIYLGTSVEDLKPFLRIGNSGRITPDIIESTYNIVLTDSLTGNPALEPLNMNRENTSENRYVGDPKITAGLLKFIREFNIQDGTVSTIEEIRKAHDRAEVHFFNDGNIQVFHNRDMLFDLRRREKNDLHFIERARLLKDIHLKNPLRYKPEDLEGPGFALIKGCPVLFQGGSILAVGVPETYFMDFVIAGIDPDFIDSIVTEEVGGAFFRLLKRKWNTRLPLRILSSKTSLMKGASGLFMETGAGKLDVSITGFGEGEKRTVSGYRLERDKRGILVKHRDMPLSLFISTSSSRESGQMTLDAKRAVLKYPGGTARIPENVVCSFRGETPALPDLVQQYCRDLYDLVDDMLGPEETSVVRMIELILDDLVERKAQTPMLKRVRKSIKKADLHPRSPLFYILSNLAGVIFLASGAHKEGGEDIAPYQALRGTALKKVSSLERVNLHLPVTGDIYAADERVAALYRPLRGAASLDSFALTRDLVRDVEERTDTYIREQEEEYMRLRTFMAALRGEPGGRKRRKITGAETAPMAAGIAGEGLGVSGVSAPGKRRKKAGVLPTEKEAASPEERQAYTTAPVQRVSYTKGMSGPLRFIIPAAVIVVAAIVLALFFLFPEVIGREAPVRKEAERRAGERAAAVDEQAAVVEEQAADQGVVQAGGAEEGAFEPDEFLKEQGIPQSTLTDRRTVLYRGLIEITLLDIYRLTNEIAVSNGYRRLDSVEQVGKDPDWIYPGNVFVLPDKTEYTVVKGDTMWYIAHRFIIKRLEEDWERYTALKNEIGAGVQDASRKERLIRELKYIRERSYSENFRREIDRTIESV